MTPRGVRLQPWLTHYSLRKTSCAQRFALHWAQAEFGRNGFCRPVSGCGCPLGNDHMMKKLHHVFSSQCSLRAPGHPFTILPISVLHRSTAQQGPSTGTRGNRRWIQILQCIWETKLCKKETNSNLRTADIFLGFTSPLSLHLNLINCGWDLPP